MNEKFNFARNDKYWCLLRFQSGLGPVLACIHFCHQGAQKSFVCFFWGRTDAVDVRHPASVTVISVVVLRYGSMLPICITSQLKLPEHSASDLVPHDSAAQRLQVKTMPWPLSSTPQAELWRWSSAALVPAPVTPPFCGLLTNVVATTTCRH